MTMPTLSSATTTITTGLILAGLTAACGGERPSGQAPREAEQSVPSTGLTEIAGCLRGGETTGTHVLVTNPDQMSASADRSTRGQVATYTYVLVGQNLEQHVGRQVSITGTIEATDDMEVEETREQASAPTKVDGDTVTPTVEVEERAVIEMRRMQVSSVQPTGEPCPTAE